MKRINIHKFVAIAGISALADASYATQPPCAGSDSSNNTACGAYALAFNRDAGGKIQGVRYDELAPMVLNEMQKQQAVIAAQAEHAAAQDAEISQLKAQLAGIQATLAQFGTGDQRIAKR